ncbi:melanopsin-like [Oculina patagonica]
MEMTNFTENGGQKRFEQLFCSADVTGGIHYQLICLSVMNIFLSITASLGNTLILVALNKESSLHSPSKLLLRNLALTDLYVGLIAHPAVIAQWMSAMNEHWDICRYSFVSSFVAGYILGSVSLLTLTAISVDRLLALLLGLRYRHVVSLKRTCVISGGFWIISIAATSMYFLNYRIILWCSYIAIPLCLLTSIFSYTKIFFTLRRHQAQVQGSGQNQTRQERRSQTIPLNIARYKKAVFSALWLQLILVVCYLPHGIVEALFTHSDISSSVFLARQFTGTLVNLNSSLTRFFITGRWHK